MTTQALEQQTHLPPEHTDQVASVLSFLEAHKARGGVPAEPQYFLSGIDEGDQVELPAAVYRVLLQVVGAMNAGKAVTVAPQSQLLTTQQAAELLGVSRPTVVKLIDAGDLPAETPGTRRRMVKLHDLLAYRKKRRDAQYRALLETTDEYLEEPEDAETEEQRFRRVRAEVAAERRARAGK